MALILSSSAVLVSYLYAANGNFALEMLIPIIAAISGTGGMCAMNDYVDVEADKLGAGDRPLPSGKISLKNGLMFAIVLTIIGMSVAGLSDKKLLPVMGGIAVLLGTSYNLKTKGLGLLGTINFGLIMVSVSLLGVVQVTHEIYHSKILLFCLFVFITASSNQLSANFYDLKSDKIYGYRTIPNTLGIKKASVLVTIFRLTSLAVLVLFFIVSEMINFILLIPFVILAILPLISLHFLKQAHDVQNAITGFRFGIIFTLLSFCTIIIGIYV